MSNDTVSIPLSGPAATGRHMLIDAGDAPLFEGRKVNMLSNGYPVICRNYKKILAHRHIMGANPGEVVDHINGDILDNRRANLRICTTAQNSRNTQKRRETEFKRVRWDKARKVWRVSLQLDGETIYLGAFDSQQFAADVYDAAAVRYFGEFARLNNPAGPTPEALAYLAEWYGPRWKVTSLKGEVSYLDTLSSFCTQHGISRVGMLCVSQGKQEHHLGWECERISMLPSRHERG